MVEVEVEEAYRRYFPIVREKCSRMLRDPTEAQDVAQETFTRLWSNRARLRNPDAIASWIYQTSTRLAVDRYRRLARTGDVAFPADDLLGSDVHNPERLGQTREVLARLAREVPARELEVAVLSRVDGLSHEEIGRVVGRSDRTVRRLLAKFELRLARLAEEAQ